MSHLAHAHWQENRQYTMDSFRYLPVTDETRSRDELITEYFKLGFTYLEILAFLHRCHGTKLGIRQLNRILKRLGLKRKRPQINVIHFIDAIEYELSSTGYTLGYRAMQRRLRNVHSISVDRVSIRLALAYIDPDGVAERRKRRLSRRLYWSKGPNYLIHLDGWDKLKPFGLCVHGGIDGFSRKILWLAVSRSNNDPFQVCHYFCQWIKQVKGLPFVVRTDRGTENVNVEHVQRILRLGNGDNRARNGSVFLYGKSTSNQRIESWWSKFKGLGMEGWIAHFKDLESHGVIDTSDVLHVECIRFCYMKLLQHELNQIMLEWNTHHIRSNPLARSPSGKPDVMYQFPQLYGAQSYLQEYDTQTYEIVSSIASEQLEDCLPLYAEIFKSVVREHKLQEPVTLSNALTMLTTLLDCVETELNELH